MRNSILLASLLCIMTFLSGCGSDSPTSEKDGKKTELQYLTIKGSDTMVHLASTWAEEFMEHDKSVEISVTGGGSGTGIAALINGTTDICAASRNIKEKEMDLAAKNNVVPQEHIVSMDGIAVIVNPENPVKELSREQISNIFTGTYTNWSEVGGKDQPILVFSRESSSGTFVFFQEHVMDKKDYTPYARLLAGTSALVQAVTTDMSAIGYVGLGFAEESAGKVAVVNVKAKDGSAAVAPSEATVVDGSYPIARPLFLYTNGEPQGAVKKFLDYALSDAGQKIVRETGYVPVH